MTGIIRRGALIVLEGCDRSGKTTQSQSLVKALCQEGYSVRLMHFPDRSTPVGAVIGHYLQKKQELEDHSIHLLFSANRWELAPKIVELLTSGTSLVVDRYAYSGAAFSAAKEGMDLEWCRQPDIGLPRPDLVVYLDLEAKVATQRNGFGQERYEESKFQEKVRKNYFALKEDNWQIIDADMPPGTLHENIKKLAIDALERVQGQELKKLWTHPFHGVS